MPDLDILLFVVNWLKAVAAIACVGFGIWALLNLDGVGGDADDADGVSDSGD